MHKIIFKIEPVPASRPRVTRYGVFYPERYSQFRKDMEKLLLGKKPLYGEPLRLQTTFFVKVPKSYAKKRADKMDGTYCVHTFDLDNLEKALYDCMNGNIYVDDKQIVEHTVKKIWVKEDPRIEVIIERLKI